MLHRSSDLSGPDGDAIHAGLRAVVDRGLVERSGVSIYSPSELDGIVPRYAIDIVQAPYSAIDQSLKTSGWLEKLKDRSIEVHTRSAMLQGLLVMQPAERPAKFAPWADLLARWDSWVASTGLTPLQGAISLACAEPGIDRVVVGVDSNAQLLEIVAAASILAPAVPATLASTDTRLINPANWTSL
jgi:aryl-alcohol dehydrogenase-like predicted oxidoreductase